MKRSLSFCFVILFLFFNISSSHSADKIAYLDLDLILKNTKLGQSILNELQSINDQNIKELKKKENQLKKVENEIKTKQNIISQEQFDKEVKNLKEKISNFRVLKDNMVQDLDSKKREDLNIFFKKINPIIQSYMNTNSIDILLERKNVFIGKNNLDITDSIILEINKNFK